MTTEDTTTDEPETPVTTDDPTPDDVEQEEPETDADETPEGDDPDDQEDDEQPDAVREANREAAGYRRRLRAAEQQNQTLTDRVAAYETADLARRATEARLQIDDVLLVTDLDDLRGEDGGLDDDLVTAHLAKVGQDRPHWLKKGRATASASRAGSRGRPHAERRGWSDVLKP